MTCDTCVHYSALKEPRTQTHFKEGEYTIYGYCFKKTKMVQEDYHKGYAVFIPEGACKHFSKKRRVKKENSQKGQLSFADIVDLT